MKTFKSSFISLALLLLLCTLFKARPLFAQSNVLQLSPVEAVTVNLLSPDKNYFGQPLELYRDWVFDEGHNFYWYKETRAVLLKFDLSDVPFTIENARFRVKASAGYGPDPIWLDSLPDDWSATTVTWNSVPYPVSGAFHQLSSEGREPFNDHQPYFWLSGAPSRLKLQQVAYGGNDFLSLKVSVVMLAYDSNFPEFDPGKPHTIPFSSIILEVADTNSELPPINDTTAIQFSHGPTTQQSNLPLMITLLCLGITTGIVAVTRPKKIEL